MIVDPKRLCEGLNIEKLKVFEDVLRDGLIKRKSIDLLFCHCENFCDGRLFDGYKVLSEDSLIAIEHKVRNLKKPAVDGIDVGLERRNLFKRIHFLLLSFLSRPRKSKFQRTCYLYIHHHHTLYHKLPQLHH